MSGARLRKGEFDNNCEVNINDLYYVSNLIFIKVKNNELSLNKIRNKEIGLGSIMALSKWIYMKIH